MSANDDLIYQYYREHGFTGTLQDMEKQFYLLGGPALFSKDSSGNVTGLVGIKASGSKFPFDHPVRTIGVIGDSITQLQGRFGLAFSGISNITGVCASDVPYGSLTCPAGSGTLTWSAANQTLTWTAPTDTAGTPVVVTDGVYDLPSGNPNFSLKVTVTARLLSVTDKSDTLTSGIRYWRRDTGGWCYIVDALTRNRFVFKTGYGIGGNRSSDILNRVDQVLEDGIDILIEESGTNSVVAGGSPAAKAIADRVAIWDKALARGIPVIATLIPPRWGVGTASSADAANYSAALQANIVAANQGYVKEAALRPGVYIADCYSKSVTQTSANGAVKTQFTADGLHPNGGLSYEMAEPIARILNNLVPMDQTGGNVGSGANYDAANNIGGNLMNPNQGAFTGTAGVPGTGVTPVAAWVALTVYAIPSYVISNGNLYKAVVAGTSGAAAPSHVTGDYADGTVVWRFVEAGVTSGLATGWNAQVTLGTATVGAYQAVAADGGSAWQKFIVNGASADGTQVYMTSGAPTITRFSAGDLLNCKFEYDIAGSGCYGVVGDVLLTGGVLPVWEASSVQNIYQGMRAGGGVLAWEPLVFPANVTAVQPRLYLRSKIAGDFTIGIRNLDLHKVV